MVVKAGSWVYNLTSHTLIIFCSEQPWYTSHYKFLKGHQVVAPGYGFAVFSVPVSILLFNNKFYAVNAKFQY